MPSFFLGIRLPKPLEEEIETWRRAFQAPTTVAHITLIPPFMWDKEKSELVQLLQKSVQTLKPFFIKGEGWGHFGTRVLFVNVQLEPDLKRLHTELAKTLAKEKIARERRRYRPHITLASRLNRRQFQRFQKEVADYHPHYSFLVNEFSLFLFNKEKKWEEANRIPLN